MTTKHPQVWANLRQDRVEVDAGMKDILETIAGLGYTTNYSCEAMDTVLFKWPMQQIQFQGLDSARNYLKECRPPAYEWAYITYNFDRKTSSTWIPAHL